MSAEKKKGILRRFFGWKWSILILVIVVDVLFLSSQITYDRFYSPKTSIETITSTSTITAYTATELIEKCYGDVNQNVIVNCPQLAVQNQDASILGLFPVSYFYSFIITFLAAVVAYRFGLGRRY